MNRLKLFFTDKTYRQIIFFKLKIKFFSLPGIKQISLWYFSYKIAKRREKMTPWEQYCEDKEFEKGINQIMLLAKSLHLGLIALDPQITEERFKELSELKTEILAFDLIYDFEYKELKACVENIDFNQVLDENEFLKFNEIQGKILRNN